MTNINDESAIASAANPSFDANAFAETFQKFRDAFALIAEGAKDETNAHEAMTEAASEVDFHSALPMNAEVFAGMIMQFLPSPEGRIPRAMKTFWMGVGTTLGPDWIGELKRVADFMSAVDEF